MDDRLRFQRDYAPAFLQYVSTQTEGGLRAGYELGRRAMSDGLSLLDLAQIHHAELFKVLRNVRDPDELDQIATAASRFFVELLATFEMGQRGFAELRRTVQEYRVDAQGRSAELERQVPVHRATGMLMERHGLPADAAERRLEELARRTGVTVEEVATRVADRRSPPPAGPPPRGRRP